MYLIVLAWVVAPPPAEQLTPSSQERDAHSFGLPWAMLALIFALTASGFGPSAFRSFR